MIEIVILRILARKGLITEEELKDAIAYLTKNS